MNRDSLPDRIRAKIEDGPDGCWLWTAGQDGHGYGTCWWDGAMRKAHRVVYGILVGGLVPDLCLDHLCRVTRCVNPAHLEQVTTQVNTERGLAGEPNRRKTHCPQGHEYTPENTYVLPSRPTARYCRACAAETSNERCRRYYHRRKAS